MEYIYHYSIKELSMILRVSLVSLIMATAITHTDASFNKPIVGKIVDFLGQSTIMHLFDKHVQTPISEHTTQKILNYGNETASQIFEEMGKEAQTKLGIHYEQQVPTRKLNPNSPMAQFVGALAEPNAIYVNEEKLHTRTYGALRSMLFHEAVHRKYHDLAMDWLLETVVLLSSGFMVHKLLKKFTHRFRALRAIMVIIASLSAASGTSSVFHHYMERRADIEGHYATECSVCAHESAEQRRISFGDQNNPLRDNGYLWAKELEIIANDLKEQNKLCLHHKT